MTERDADQIQREIEQARVSLASAVDQISHRAHPKRVSENLKQVLREKAESPAGKAVIAGAGVLVLLLVVRRIRMH